MTWEWVKLSPDGGEAVLLRRVRTVVIDFSNEKSTPYVTHEASHISNQPLSQIDDTMRVEDP